MPWPMVAEGCSLFPRLQQWWRKKQVHGCSSAGAFLLLLHISAIPTLVVTGLSTFELCRLCWMNSLGHQKVSPTSINAQQSVQALNKERISKHRNQFVSDTSEYLNWPVARFGKRKEPSFLKHRHWVSGWVKPYKFLEVATPSVSLFWNWGVV